MTVILSFKTSEVSQEASTAYYYISAKSRIRNKDQIGVLKIRWASLREMGLYLIVKEDLTHFIKWITVCVILQSMIADLGDECYDLFFDDESDHLGRMPVIINLSTVSSFSRNSTVDYRVSIRDKAVVIGHHREAHYISGTRRSMAA